MALLKAVSQASRVHFSRASLGATNKPDAKSIFFYFAFKLNLPTTRLRIGGIRKRARKEMQTSSLARGLKRDFRGKVRLAATRAQNI